MATKRGKSTDCGRAAARNDMAGNAVLAGIAAADAICCIRLGERSTSSDHSTAVLLLARVDPSLSQKLSTLIGSKPTSHYGENFISSET
jgi:hypothetical protein